MKGYVRLYLLENMPYIQYKLRQLGVTCYITGTCPECYVKESCVHPVGVQVETRSSPRNCQGPNVALSYNKGYYDDTSVELML
jgi:hypothetical protein